MAGGHGTFWTELCDLIDGGFTGNVVLHLNGGTVMKYEKHEHITVRHSSKPTDDEHPKLDRGSGKR